MRVKSPKNSVYSVSSVVNLRDVPAAKVQTKSIHLVGGDDEFSIKEAAAKLAKQLTPTGAGELGVEIIEGDAANADEALKILGRVQEALNSMGLFGGEKLVWFKSTNLLAANRTAQVDEVKEALEELAGMLKRGLPVGMTLLISAIGCDQRRTLYLTLKKLAEIKTFDAPEAGKEHGDAEIAAFIQQRVRAERKTITAEGFAAFRDLVAPEFREIANEVEKLVLYVGTRPEITAADVRAICSASRQAVIWELTDSLGARRLPAAIAAVENLLASGEEPIGLLMLLVSHLRLMLLAKDLMVRKLLVPRDGNGGNFEYVRGFEKLEPQQVAHFPRTKEGKPPSPWRLYRCAVAAKNFSTVELIRAMDILLEANRQLVSTSLDSRLVLEEAMAKIALKPPAPDSKT